ncbi:MAG TPA: AAA family ATPase, partial [Actinoplanes sp.]|nr:AAA family ATPase [Actinoplanes sp.]
RLQGVPGVAQLAPDAPAGPGVVMLQDAGETNLAGHGTPMPPAEAVALAVRLARAVAGVHARGVMHRNICPANVVVGADGAPCLVDFGLATVVAEIRPEFTPVGEIVGELAYLAPEQTGRTGRSVDLRADLYALGATLYELLTGVTPFDKGDPLRLLHDHLTRVPVPPVQLEPAVPAPLSAIVMHLLEKEPDHRYQTADGVVFDLQQVSVAAEFRLGTRDVPSQLVPPARLVGRDDELTELENAFDEALAGDCRGVLVGGAPGVGKTALIDQLRPVLAGRDGWFIAGKFDQYRRDMDADGVYQAMRALGRLLLAEPEAELTDVRERILRALGPNAGLLTAGGTEFAALLRVPPDPGDPLTAQARVQSAAVQVLRAVASRKRPVLMFVDDLQWAGRTPIGFIDLLLRGEPVDGLLLVGAYRDGDVDEAHPMAPMLNRWRGQPGVRQVRLGELPASGVAAIVAEMLHLGPGAAAAGLADVIAEQTRGNPFETVELLNALRQDGALTLRDGRWRWDDAAVRAYLDAADPARLSAGRVAALPARTRYLVRAMACLGGRAEPDLLVTATATALSEVEQRLEPALAAGLLVAEPGVQAAVRFRHDRIREGTLTGLGTERQRRLHLAMARRLARVPGLFAVAAQQYLPVVDVVTGAVERRRVVRLLRRAAEQAALIGDHILVSALLGAAVRLVDPGDTETLIAVRTMRHAALYSAGRLDDADDEFRAIDALGPTPAQRADAAAVQVYSLTHRHRSAAAVVLGVKSLRELGIAVPSADRLGDDLDRRFGHLYRWLAATDDADELARPELADQSLLTASRLLSAILPACYVADPVALVWLGLEALRIWLDHGPAPILVGPVSHTAFAAIELRGDYDAGYRVARRILALGEARGYALGTAQARFLYSLLAWQFEPIENGVAAALRAREGLIAGGDLANAGYTYHPMTYYLLDCAPSLAAVAAEVQAGHAFTLRTGNAQTGQWLAGYRWLAAVMSGQRSASAQSMSVERLAGNPAALFTAHYTGAVVAAVFGDAAALERHTVAAMPLLPAAQGAYPTAVVRLLRGLALAAQARTDDGPDRDDHLAELDELTRWLAARAADAPANFSHLVRLLEAERAWTTGDFPTAVQAFDAALREVAQRQRPWHSGLIAERAARFYLAHGVEHTGSHLITQARHAYEVWGATGKVNQIEWAYPTLLATSDTSTEPGAGQQSDPAKVTSGTIDLLGILAATQAISSETTIERLHTRVADVLGAMTGATSVRLLLYSDESRDWLITGPDGATGIGGGRERSAPLTVLRYVQRTGEPLLVTDT